MHYVFDVNKYGYGNILEPLVSDLKFLFREGLMFNEKLYKIVLWQIIGDNLDLLRASQQIIAVDFVWSTKLLCIP